MKQKEKVLLEAFRCECRDCSQTSEVYSFTELEYGRRILRTEDGIDFGLVICYDDKVFKEVGDLVKSYCNGKKYSEIKIADCFDQVFGLACDSINGKNINAFKGPSCKFCGSENIERFSYQPPKDVELEIPMITHTLWEQKNVFERKMIINKALEEKCT